MPSAAHQIIRAVQAALIDQTIVGEKVFLQSSSVFEREEYPAIVIDLLGEDSESYGRGVDLNDVKFRVVFLARNDDWQTQLDPVWQQSNELILTKVTPLFGEGVLRGLRRTKMTTGAQSADSDYGFIAQEYTAKYLSNSIQLNFME